MCAVHRQVTLDRRVQLPGLANYLETAHLIRARVDIAGDTAYAPPLR